MSSSIYFKMFDLSISIEMVGVASTAFNGIKEVFQAGRDVRIVMSQDLC